MVVRRASRRETLKTRFAQIPFVCFCLNITGDSVGFLKAAVIWVFLFFVFAISFHS